MRLVLVLLLALATLRPAAAEDRHAGYYYPEPQSTETYVSQVRSLPESDRRRRIGFTVELTKTMFQRPYAPPYAIFAKGDDAEKLIVVALYAGPMDTIYRVRAALAQLTALSRDTPLFRKIGGEDSFNFFDLLRLLGFTQVTLSDGDKFTHQVTLE